MTNLSEYSEKILSRIEEDRGAFEAALQIFDVYINSGKPLKHSQKCIFDSLGILLDLHMDLQTLVCGLFSAIPKDEVLKHSDFLMRVGKNTLAILELNQKIKTIDESAKKQERISANIRQLFHAAALEPRVLFIKISYMLANLREAFADIDSPARKTYAEEALEIYTPLTDRLGLQLIKNELQNTSFKILYPQENQEIQNFLAEIKADKNRLTDIIKDKITACLKHHGIVCLIYGRIKENYSIYQKTIQKNLPLNKLFDLLAFRVITQSAKEAYDVLGIIHSEFKPINNRFKDYIAKPKINGYRSLHTSIVDDENNCFEVQIRDHEMDAHAQQGMAAHWAYKSGSKKHLHAIDWVMALDKHMASDQNPGHILTMFQGEMSSNIFAFTPKGRIIKLPANGTVIDFAYAIHSEIGNHCSGAMIDGKLSNIRTKLENGSVIEIITSPHTSPKPDWLKVAVTSKAIQHIRNAIKKHDAALAREEGGKLLRKFFKKFGPRYDKIENHPWLPAFLRKLKLGSAEELLERLGDKTITPESLKNITAPQDREEPARQTDVRPSELTVAGGSSYIQGQRFIPVRFAKCCSPIYPDHIFGLADGTSMAIHKASCDKFSNGEIDERKLIDIAWENPARKKLTMKIELTYPLNLSTTIKILKEIGKKQDTFHSSHIQKKGDQLYQHLVLSSSNENHLLELVEKLKTIKSVSSNVTEQSISTE